MRRPTRRIPRLTPRDARSTISSKAHRVSEPLLTRAER
jgi:hypothetical protein